jgi:hypothetical protein
MVISQIVHYSRRVIRFFKSAYVVRSEYALRDITTTKMGKLK